MNKTKKVFSKLLVVLMLLSTAGNVLVNPAKGSASTDMFIEGMEFPNLRQIFATGDIDGDGDNDIVFGYDWEPKYIEIWENKGNQTFVQKQTIQPQCDYWRYTSLNDIVLGDLDNDNDIDLVAAYSGNSCDLVAQNDGNGNFTDASIDFGQKNTQSVGLGDMNSDGFLDIVVGKAHTIQVYQNDITNPLSFTKVYSKGTSIDGTKFHAFVQVGDLDNDGDQDVFSGASDTTYTNWFRSFTLLNTGDGVNYDVTATDAQKSSTGFPAMSLLLDWDNDNDLDVLLNKRKYVNDGTGSFSYVGLNSVGADDSGDIDLDGDIDFVSSKDLFLNDGQGNFASNFNFYNDTPNSGGDANIADLDGDGDLDVLANGKVWWNTTIKTVDLKAKINKSVSSIKQQYIYVGDEFEYTVNVTNKGPNSSKKVKTVVNLPKELIVVEKKVNPTTITFSEEILETDESTEYKILVKAIAPTPVYEKVVAARVNITGDGFDTNESNNYDTDAVIIKVKPQEEPIIESREEPIKPR